MLHAWCLCNCIRFLPAVGTEHCSSLLHVWGDQCLPAWHECTAMLGGPCLLHVARQVAQLDYCLPAQCKRPTWLEGVMPAAYTVQL